MKLVHIGFSSPHSKKIGAELIKLWQGGTAYSHVYLRVYSSYTDETLVYQASHGLVNCFHISAFLENNKVVREFEVPLEPERLQACIKRAQQLLGRPYGFAGLLKLAAKRIFNCRVNGDENRSFHCSEFLAALFPDLAAKSQIVPDFLEPVHLYKVLEKEAIK